MSDARAFAGVSPHRRAGITFRSITDEDRDFLCALYASTRAEELAPVPWPEEAKRAFLAQQFQLQHTHYRNTYADADFWLILADGEPVGRIYVQRTETELRVIEVSLVPAWRGRGLGSSLFAELIDEARRTQREITLHVESFNPARRLYARLGFRFIENRGVYDLMSWSPPAATRSS